MSEPAPAGMPANISPTTKGIPWQPAFIAFCRGFSLEEISEHFKIPLPTLSRRAAEEQWAVLASELPLLKREKNTTRADLERLEANRSANLKMFADLRREVTKALEKYSKGELMLERLFHHQRTATIVRAEQVAGPDTLLQLANAARIVSEGTYRALGDVTSQEDPSKRGAAAPAQITILLPGVVASKPSAPAAEVKDAEVIDLS